MNPNTKKFLIVSIAIVLLVGAGVALAYKSGDGKSADSVNDWYTVERGDLAIEITETGTIKSRDQHIIKSEVEGRSSIIYVIDEGVHVTKGELLVELDSSELQDRLVDQQIQVEKTDADYVSSKENLEVAKIRNQSNIAQAELANQFAIEDKVKYLEGEWPKTLMESETELTLAKEDLNRATDKFDWSEKLFAEEYLSETEFRADELSRKRAELQVALAEERLDLLKEYTHPRKLAELDSEVTQKELSLEQVNREAASDLVQAKARLIAIEAEFNRQQGRLKKIEDQISKTMLVAPVDGMVVYATSAEFSWRGDTQPLDEGQEVRERQELIHLPTIDSMMVVIRIHESSLGKISLGQSVQVKINALPGKQYVGRVTKIAPLPDAASAFMNPDLKVYDTQIMIDGIFPEIRTGMSCEATILVDEYEDALFVPMQAVVGRGTDTVVYVKNGNMQEARVVETGLDNKAMIHILSGINVGDQVMMTPPLGGGDGKKNQSNKTKSDDKAINKTDASSDSTLQRRRSGGRPSGGQP
tara:strand:+ start:251575 stop:253164 length:1590 start_codon:yes stop_codon:yes gene_type:complete